MKFFMLPGSIWREDKPALIFRQRNSNISSVQICARLCKKLSAIVLRNPFNPARANFSLSLSLSPQLQFAHT